MLKNFPKLLRDEIYIHERYASEVQVNKPFSHKKKTDDLIRDRAYVNILISNKYKLSQDYWKV